eukprot:2374915-Amphidinium_carterae.1
MARDAGWPPSATTGNFAHSLVSVVTQPSSGHSQLAPFRAIRRGCHTSQSGFIMLVTSAHGKTRGGAAFKIAVPSHVSAGNPLMQDLQSLIRERLGDELAKAYFIPDVESSHQALLGPAVLLKRQMTYSIIAAMSLSMSEDEQDALGDWTDRVGSARSRTEPMAVRYSASRLEKSAGTNRCLLAALSSVASADLPPTWDSIAQLTTSNPIFEKDALSEAWGRHTQMSQPMLIAPPLPLASTNASAEAASPSPSSSDSTSASDSSESEDVKATDCDDDVEWLLPKGPRSLLHVRYPSREDGQAYCQR